MSTLGFYRAFEERFYAPRSTIKKLRQQYLPFVQPLAALYPGAATFDIGCGRGEWLELMQELGMSPFGVDLDAGMLQGCHELNLPAEQGDAVAYLQTLADNSQAVVSAFHVVEHISFEQLQTVVAESLRVLRPGGLLIMETPNPENIVVATRNFYLDPTHLRPIPSLLLSFLPEHQGFARVHTLRLQESPALQQRSDISLMDVLGGVSPDYAVVAQKAAALDVMERFDTVFGARYGIDLNDLAGRYDGTLQRRMAALDQRLTNAEAQAQAGGMTEAIGRISSLQDRLLAVSIELTRKEAECEHLQSRVTQIPAQVETAEQYAHAMSVRAQEAEDRAQSMQSSLVEVNERFDVIRQELHQVHQSNHHHWQLAETRQQKLDAVYSSWSWRVTAPLRWIGGLLLHPVATVRAGANKFVHYSINTSQRPLSRLMAAVLRRPQLSYRINRVLVRYPALYRQLLEVAQRGGVMAGVPVHSAHTAPATSSAASELASLTPRARQIYADLQKAINKNRRAD